jgi:hypothetical protein
LRLTKWLLDQNSPSDKSSMRIWVVNLLGSYLARDSGTREPALRLFFDDRHLSMDTLTLKTCLRLSHHLETFEVIFRNSQKHYSVMSESARIGFGAKTSTPRDSAAVYMAKVGLSIAELAVVQFPEPKDGSALHHVAEAFSDFGDDRADNVIVEEWLQLGVGIIRNGADLFSVKKWGRTPLLVILQRPFWEGSPHSRIRRRLQRWNDMLRRADVDLEWYCAKETETWKNDGFARQFPLCSSSAWLVKLQFCHATQSCIPVFRDEFTIPVMRLRLVPGSFVGSQYPIETICWGVLSKEEEEEGHWSRAGSVVIRSSHTYDYDPQQEHCSWYNKLIDCTQDDNGTFLRMTRSPRNSNRSSKRASSQPPSQHRTRQGEQLLFSSRTHTWLPPYHYCHVRCTWTVSCHHRRLDYWTGPSSSNEPRLCVYQKDNDDNENYLEGRNFLGEIRDCKFLRHRFGDPLHPILRHSHRIGCPQGCDQVDLKKLAKPRDLQRWHPCRDEL